MEEKESVKITNRNYNTISPSAKLLLLMKGHTNIPFARQTAELIKYPEKYAPDFSRKDVAFWERVVHFESRYWSIDQLLSDLPVKNILELSSGYSLRGLEKIQEGEIHYIDTDLPDMITPKKDIYTELQKENNTIKGKMEVLPLNALDEMQFIEVVGHFPEGEIAIVNEGLLMYLDVDEKEKLFSIIHKILKERGGYWITADIYLKNQAEKLDLNYDKRAKEFFEQHNIEENKFNSFDEAKLFFNKAGFTIDKESNVENSKLSSLKYLKQSVTTEKLTKMRQAGKIQTSWRLKVTTD